MQTWPTTKGRGKVEGKKSLSGHKAEERKWEEEKEKAGGGGKLIFQQRGEEWCLKDTPFLRVKNEGKKGLRQRQQQHLPSQSIGGKKRK